MMIYRAVWYVLVLIGAGFAYFYGLALWQSLTFCVLMWISYRCGMLEGATRASLPPE